MKGSTTYILFSEQKDCFLIGHTSNLEQRVQKYNTPGQNRFRKGAPWLLLFYEEHENTEKATLRAKRLRQLKKKAVQKLLFHHRWAERVSV